MDLASNNSAVVGDNTGGGTGVRGSSSAAGAGVIGVLGTSYNGIGIKGIQGPAGGLAGRFEGDVEVTGDIRLVNADCAEDATLVANYDSFS